MWIPRRSKILNWGKGRKWKGDKYYPLEKFVSSREKGKHFCFLSWIIHCFQDTKHNRSNVIYPSSVAYDKISLWVGERLAIDFIALKGVFKLYLLPFKTTLQPRYSRTIMIMNSYLILVLCVCNRNLALCIPKFYWCCDIVWGYHLHFWVLDLGLLALILCSSNKQFLPILHLETLPRTECPWITIILIVSKITIILTWLVWGYCVYMWQVEERCELQPPHHYPLLSAPKCRETLGSMFYE